MIVKGSIKIQAVELKVSAVKSRVKKVDFGRLLTYYHRFAGGQDPLKNKTEIYCSSSAFGGSR